MTCFLRALIQDIFRFNIYIYMNFSFFIIILINARILLFNLKLKRNAVFDQQFYAYVYLIRNSMLIQFRFILNTILH